MARSVSFRTTYLMEQTVAKEFTCALDEHGRLKLLTLLSKAGLSFARVMNTQRIVTTDREGFVSNVDLTVAEVMDLEGLRLLGEHTIKDILERPSGSGIAIFEGRFVSTGSTDVVVTSFPDRLVECSIEAVVNEWYEDWIRTVRSDALDEITCRSFSGDCRAPSCLYLSEPSCNATFYGMTANAVNCVLEHLGINFKWTLEPNQQRSSEIGAVSVGKPDLQLQEFLRNRRWATTEGKMLWILHQGKTATTSEERQILSQTRGDRPYRVDPNEPPINLVTLYNQTSGGTSVRFAFAQEAGYMASDEHLLGFLHCDAILYMLLRHPDHPQTLFVSKPIMWMQTGLTQRKALLFGTMVQLGKVPTAALVAAMEAALPRMTRSQTARGSQGTVNRPTRMGSRLRISNTGSRGAVGTQQETRVSDAPNDEAWIKGLELTRAIYNGHAGTVFEGRYEGIPVIIKTTDTAQGSGGMELLRNEATTAALLEPLWNRTVPPLLTSGFVAPCVYANVFKKIEGQVITAAALAQALEALKSVHGLGFLHGDVKADHFLATKAGQVYLVDFGLSRRATGKGEFAREERELWHSLR